MFSSMPNLVFTAENGYKSEFSKLTTICCGFCSCKTTVYGGIFNPWNRFTSAGHEKSPVFGPGIRYLCVVLVCLHQHGLTDLYNMVFSSILLTWYKPPPVDNFNHYTMEGGGKSIEKPIILYSAFAIGGNNKPWFGMKNVNILLPFIWGAWLLGRMEYS